MTQWADLDENVLHYLHYRSASEHPQSRAIMLKTKANYLSTTMQTMKLKKLKINYNIKPLRREQSTQLCLIFT